MDFRERNSAIGELKRPAADRFEAAVAFFRGLIRGCTEATIYGKPTVNAIILTVSVTFPIAMAVYRRLFPRHVYPRRADHD